MSALVSVLCLLLILHLPVGENGPCGRCIRRNTSTGELTVKCKFNDSEYLSAADIPEGFSKLEIISGKELRFHPDLLTKFTCLQSFNIAYVKVLLVQEPNITNSSMKKVSFEFEDGEHLFLQGKSWGNVSSPISVSIRRFRQFTIQQQALPFLYNLTISQVTIIAFYIDQSRPYTNTDFQITSFLLDNVKLITLPPEMFYSTAKEVIIRNSNITILNGNTFSAIAKVHVLIENTTIQKVENNTFSESTVLHTLTLDRVRIDALESGAVLSGATKLIILNSRFGTLHPGSFNVTVATAKIIGNSFSRIHRNAVILKKCDFLGMNNNNFSELDRHAFTFRGGVNNNTPIIHFIGNNLYNISQNAFDFRVNEELNSTVENNIFIECQCNMSERIKIFLFKTVELREKLLRTALCSLRSKHWDLPEGFYSVLNFTKWICPNKVNLCEEVQRDAARRILGPVFIIVLGAMILMMILSAVMWIGRNGYCSKARILLLPSTNSFINYLTSFFSGSGMTPTGSAHSISRLSIHEYAELQGKIGEAKEEEEIPLEDKATQTLPEELTQELLQSLQEKLNEPENYSEASNVLKHLFNLIKVEESCNKNYKDLTSINLGDLDRVNENVYDVIVQKRKTSSREKKETVSTGTRAPSPDKLMPYTVYGETLRLQPAVCDYMEPKDRQVHTYTELPNRTPAGPNSIVCDYGEPTDTRVHLYTELPANIKMANRPLPSKPVDGGQSMS